MGKTPEEIERGTPAGDGGGLDDRNFEQRTIDRDTGNIEKHGHQSFCFLLLCTVEELGEITEAYIDGEGPERIRAEIIDAAALLRRLFYQAGESYETETTEGKK